MMAKVEVRGDYTNQIRRGVERIFAQTIDDLVVEYLSLFPGDHSTAEGVLSGFAGWLKREVGCEEKGDDPE